MFRLGERGCAHGTTVVAKDTLIKLWYSGCFHNLAH